MSGFVHLLEASKISALSNGNAFDIRVLQGAGKYPQGQVILGIGCLVRSLAPAWNKSRDGQNLWQVWAGKRVDMVKTCGRFGLEQEQRWSKPVMGFGWNKSKDGQILGLSHNDSRS